MLRHMRLTTGALTLVLAGVIAMSPQVSATTMSHWPVKLTSNPHYTYGSETVTIKAQPTRVMVSWKNYKYVATLPAQVRFEAIDLYNVTNVPGEKLNTQVEVSCTLKRVDPTVCYVPVKKNVEYFGVASLYWSKTKVKGGSQYQYRFYIASSTSTG